MVSTNPVKTFDSKDTPLQDLLKGIETGATQFPDFQRGWVWDDEHIRSLLASVSLAYPIGAVMLLEAGGQDVRFQTRPVEGAPETNVTPSTLILDGQQRLTSLYLALSSGIPVKTRDARGKSVERWYYLDIEKTLNPDLDREEAIVGIPIDRKVLNFRGEVVADYSTPDLERQAGMLPVSIIFDHMALMDWGMKYVQAGQSAGSDGFARWNDLTQQAILRFQQYHVPVIELKRGTPKEAVCQVFEKVNTGGVSLTVFELLTATFAADGFHLREDWAKRQRSLREHPVLHGIENTDFLQAVTLLGSRHRREDALHQVKPLDQAKQPDQAPGISCKRKDVLRLTLDEYQRWADPVTEGFKQAAKLLYGQKVYSARGLPYRTQLTPLAAILTVLGSQAETAAIRGQLARWYWCGVFGELYGGSIESRFARDLPEVLSWVSGGPEPITVTEAAFQASRLLSMRTRNSAAYKGVSALLIRDGGQDFRTGVPVDEARYFDERIDVHHIFPQAWCRKKQVPSSRFDSIVNKTPLAAKTNRMIGGNAPSTYLPRITKDSGLNDSEMDSVLRSHVVEPDYLRADDFDAFFAARQKALLDRIEAAMGKPVMHDITALQPVLADDDEDVEEDENEAA